jgi:hypothetical protein
VRKRRTEIFNTGNKELSDCVFASGFIKMVVKGGED